MGTSTSKPRYQCHVVIVGGGYGGITAAVQLDAYCQVTLIDPKDAFHNNLGALRGVVEPSFIKKTFIPYENALKNGTFIKAKCVSVHLSLKKVTLSDGQEIEYEYLIFACGSSNPFPGKK
jgi:NADH dehydrogenase FAD-containing subunit